jgi:hypothetical protein
MRRRVFRLQICSMVAAIQLLVLVPAFAQEISLKSGESADIHSVYWVGNCRSLLISFAGVDILEGPPGVTLSIREEEVLPRRQNCPNKVPGGVVVASVKEVPTRTTGILKYRVRYNTTEGLRQSNHSVRLSLDP